MFSLICSFRFAPGTDEMSVRLGPDRGTYLVEEPDQAGGDDEGRAKQLMCTVHYLDHTNNSFMLDVSLMILTCLCQADK